MSRGSGQRAERRVEQPPCPEVACILVGVCCYSCHRMEKSFCVRTFCCSKLCREGLRKEYCTRGLKGSKGSIWERASVLTFLAREYDVQLKDVYVSKILLSVLEISSLTQNVYLCSVK